MLYVLVFVIPGADSVFHNAETNLVTAAPFDQMVTQGARFAQYRGVAQIPYFVFGVVLTAVVTVIPAPVSAITAAL